MSDTTSIASGCAALRAKLYAPGFVPMTPMQRKESRWRMMASLVVIDGETPAPEPIAPPATAAQKRIIKRLRAELHQLEKKFHEISLTQTI